MKKTIRILVAGCGYMGSAHSKAYAKMEGVEIVGLVSRKPDTRERLSSELGGIETFSDFDPALSATKPDAVSINTYTESHAQFCMSAMENGAHVFVEKPLAETFEKAEAVVQKAVECKRKLVVGYILRHHPSWNKFIEIAGSLGKPLVMRMNLNQQSDGEMWQHHKSLLNSVSPIVDCGVHYVDVMCQMTRSKPVRVQAVGARLTEEIDPEMYNYGVLQVTFADGSVGWYESAWGPMISETAYFVKDVIGPKGSVSIVGAGHLGKSADIESHTSANTLLIHHSEIDANKAFTKKDERIPMEGEPGHQELCNLEQAFFINSIREDIDLADHMQDAVSSLQIVLAADKSVRSGKTIQLES